MDLNGNRILVVKQSSLGDVIHTFPTTHALKRCFPQCSIGWVVEQGYAALVGQDDSVDRVHPMHIPSTSSPDSTWFSYGSALAATLRVLHDLRRSFAAAPYDLILDLHASFRSGLMAVMNPGGLRVGFKDARELNTLFQHRLLDVPEGTVHAVDKNLLFASHFACPVVPADFYLCSSTSDEERVAVFLSQSGIGPDDRFVYVNPAARWQSKFWLETRWSRLCDRLADAGVRAVFGGSGSDVAYIQEVIGRMNHSGAAIAAGQLSLTESVALMKRASAYVGLDTGPMHIAAMAGVPVAALFGPTHPERVGPYRVRNVIVRAENVPCLCCRKRVCDHMSCMRSISVEQVFAAVMGLL
ncbi:glycosyltransferase family 9 protein [Desulfobulbus sp.]|uniref:glycosyltransferase family 9 protein n=1 Tax=Desulfobulbus sp. TaxID=895 RepID=UPI0027BB1C63|nr:glycosyltransferase family 9 protein [Desulfobulbus sp.]